MVTFRQSIQKVDRPFRTLFVEYCDNSRIHGVRYLTKRFLHWSERLWWIIALCASLGVCGYAALNIWIEWRDNPVTLSYSEPSIPIAGIPFPTVTICPEIKADKHLFDLSATLKGISELTEQSSLVLSSMAHICPHLAKILELRDKFAHEAIHKILYKIAPRHEATVQIASRLHTVPVFTEEGICFTYNALNLRDIYTDDMTPDMEIINNNEKASNWSLEKDVFGRLTVDSYLIHEIRTKPLAAFSANLKARADDLEYQCKASDQGYKMIVSTPGDALQFSDNSFRVPFEEDMIISIKPTLTITSDGLRKYDPHQRQCFFDSERRLRFFKIYSQSNCEAECLANFTNAMCGCVKFSQPRDRHTKVCGGAKITCYKMYEEILSSGDSAKSFRDKCNCMPSCTSIDYEIDIERMSYNMENIRKAFTSFVPDFKFPPIRLTRVQIFFESEHVRVVKRIESNTLIDFLAFCGGLLGMFLGVSALSIVDIVYHLTLRLYFIIRPVEVSNAVIPFQAWVQQDRLNIFTRFRAVRVLIRAVRVFFRGIRAFVVEFCDNSSIHGVSYFTRRGLHWIERLWWIISFGVSLWLCTTIIIGVWNGWQYNPVKMTHVLNETPISAVPFPTVTICPYIKFMRHKLDLGPFVSEPLELRKIVTSINNSLRDNKTYQSVLHVCSNVHSHFERGQMRSFPARAGENIFHIIRDIAPQFDDVINQCIWQGHVIDCSRYMAPILTEAGLCFTFNALNSHEIYTDEMAPGMKIAKSNSNEINWSIETGYKNGTKHNDYPLRVHNSGPSAALEISLDIFEKDFDLFCSLYDQGFGVALGLPFDESQFRRNMFRVSLLEQTVITMNPKLTTTSGGLRSYHPNHRKCFFDSERKLRFYKTYTQNNCQVECLANLTRRECGCVKFSHPRGVNTPVCGVGEIMCYVNIESRLLMHLAPEMEFERMELKWCNCLPSCTTIEYNPVVDRVHFDQSAIAMTAGRNANVSGIQRAKLVIYFENQRIETKQRDEFYTIRDLFSICGGLLGLFMGISVLSIVEIIYYSSLRWYGILRRPTSQSN